MLWASVSNNKIVYSADSDMEEKNTETSWKQLEGQR